MGGAEPTKGWRTVRRAGLRQGPREQARPPPTVPGMQGGAVLLRGLQSRAWPDHKASCQARQAEVKAEIASKKAQEKAEREAKMEEALASFVPLCLTPQVPGGGGKKGKKKGGGKGKKKKGKK